MSVENLTPDSAVLTQLDGQWQKMLMILLWKLNGREKVVITHEEMEQFRKEFEPGIPVLYSHGHSDSIEFSLIDEAAARRLAEHEKTQQGHA